MINDSDEPTQDERELIELGSRSTLLGGSFRESYQQWLRQIRRDRLTPEDVDALWCAEMEARDAAARDAAAKGDPENEPDDDPEPPSPAAAGLPDVGLMHDDELVAVGLDPGADGPLLDAVVAEILVRIRRALADRPGAALVRAIWPDDPARPQEPPREEPLRRAS